ncbi:MAG: hypothetical protein AAFQ80_19945 [Cyanobacteria bacterium J06621_8]
MTAVTLNKGSDVVGIAGINRVTSISTIEVGIFNTNELISTLSNNLGIREDNWIVASNKNAIASSSTVEGIITAITN